ncbi:MAG TPA: hypothetical protein VLX91_17160 [Candidatus Acidoferrales bacterium]|nr:hypothetical protein [Candidatus Acidoferrales bacterium]
MSKPFKKQLVIDASIARAAGFKSVRGVTCIEFMERVRDICNQLVMTEKIHEEWNRNASKYAFQWAASMKSLGKLRDLEAGDPTTLLKKIESLEIGDAQKRAMLKDVCLIVAAKSSECRVVSLDEEARELYRKFGDPLQELNGVLWINPEKQDDDAMGWLERGTPSEDALLLRQKQA